MVSVRGLQVRSRRVATAAYFRALKSAQYLPGESKWSAGPKRVAMLWYADPGNFGDTVAPLIVSHFTGRTPVWVPFDYAPKVLSTGSIVERAQKGDVIVGSGAISTAQTRLPSGVTVLAVRGPLTAQLLGLKSQVSFGDPGLLAPEVLGVSNVQNRSGPIGVIPHFADKQLVRLSLATMRNEDLRLLDIQEAPRRFLENVAVCRCCISSSLHGIIAAESLGIPAIWMVVSDHLIGGEFKFHDYYLGTGRIPPSAIGLLEAVEKASGQVEAFRPDDGAIRLALEELRVLLENGRT